MRLNVVSDSSETGLSYPDHAGRPFGYIDRFMAVPRDNVKLYVHSLAEYKIDIMRNGPAGLEEAVYSVEGRPGKQQKTEENFNIDGANWEVTDEFWISPEWKGGLYRIRLTDINGNVNYVPLIVSDVVAGSGANQDKKPITLITSYASWVTYNYWTLRSVYRYYPKDESTRRNQPYMSLYRPWHNNSPFRSDAPLDGTTLPGIRMKHLADIEEHFIQFLEREGYPYRVIPDIMLDINPHILDDLDVDVLIASGHSEYWSPEMLDTLKVYLRRGGSFINFSGNSMYRKVWIHDKKILEYKHDRAKRVPVSSLDTTRQDTGGRWINNNDGEAAIFATTLLLPTPVTGAPYEVLNKEQWMFRDVAFETKKGKLIFGRKGTDAGFVGTGASGGETDGFKNKYLPNIEGTGYEVVARGQSINLDRRKRTLGADMLWYKHNGGGIVLSAGSTNYVTSLHSTEGDEPAKQVTRNILNYTIKGDFIAPITTLNGSSEVTINVGESYTDAGAVCSDNEAGCEVVEVGNTVNVDKAGSYMVSYKSYDAMGNNGNVVKRSVIVQ